MVSPIEPAQAAILRELHAEIDERVARMRAAQPDWNCARGCDGCCHRLADAPQLSAAEWALLREGLSAQPSATLAEIAGRMAELDAPPPLRCPLLDTTSGACRVYAWRPVACRTYGFYMQRGIGLYCGELEARAARGELDAVIWGNHDAIDRELAHLGPARPLQQWFAEWQAQARAY